MDFAINSLVIDVIIVFILFLYGIYYLLVIQNSEYYTQIDNSKIEGLSTTDSMKYQVYINCI